MKVCYFGTYIKDYIRNRVIIKGLKEHKLEVSECHYPLWKGNEPRIGKIKGYRGLIFISISYIKAYLFLFLQAFDILKKPDVIIVGYTGHLDVPLAYLLSRIWRIPLVFDFHISLHNTFIKDRKVARDSTFISKFLRFIDRFSLSLSDLALLDTNAHIDHISKNLMCSRSKFKRLWVGEDPEIFHPVDVKKFEDFTVIYFGEFIPLHGMEYIIEAARILEEKKVQFLLVGKGQLFEKTKSRAIGLKNVIFKGWVEYQNLPELISKSHISLGIFGNTDKAYRVIPNKIYESIACNIPVITGDTPAINEIFEHSKNIYLCRMADGASLANAIMKLKTSKQLRDRISTNAYTLYKEKFTPYKIGKEIINELNKLELKKTLMGKGSKH